MLHGGVTASGILAGRLRLQPHASGHKPPPAREEEEEEEEEEKFPDLGLVQQNNL